MKVGWLKGMMGMRFHVYKVMCSIVQQRMTQMLEEKQLLAEEQGGLRKGRGCRYQVLTLMLLLWRRL